MRLTELDKANLKRFGCTLHAGEEQLVVMWTDFDRDQALGATILVRGIYQKCAVGPLPCLALEISPTPALAHYHYFPFNLKNHGQRAYLRLLGLKGRLQLAFVTGRKIIVRDHQLLPTQQKQVTETLSKAVEALGACTSYKFSDVVDEFERTTRIPQFFERAVSDQEIFETLESLRAKANGVSAEKRELAHQIVHGLADVLQNQFGEKVRKFLTDMLGTRTALSTLFDYQREFGDDYERIVNTVTEHVAVNTNDEALRKASDWPRKVESILKTFEDANTSAEQRQKASSEFTAALGRALNYVSRGRGLSVNVLKEIVLPFRTLLPAQPGRPTEDYGKEYEWKASGMSWTEVATKHFQENADVRAEFNESDYSSLAGEDKEMLRNRVREGVRSHAERTGKLFPLPEPGSVEAQKT